MAETSRKKEWFKTMAKKTGAPAKELKQYRKEAEKEAEKQDVKDPGAYATAVMLRRAQETGKEPHKKIGESRRPGFMFGPGFKK